MPINTGGFKTLYRIKDRGVNSTQATSKPNGIKQWLLFGDISKCGVRRQILISSLEITLWIITESLVCSCVIINGLNFLLLICDSFLHL